MVFSSVTFLFYFLPLFLALYFLTPFKNTVLLCMSLIFYAWGEPAFVLLLVVSISINYIFRRIIDHYSSNTKIKFYALAFGVGINVLIIGYYKYLHFILNDVFLIENEKAIHLPLGISFFTFQAISYLVDVYRKEAQVEKNIFSLALYISMFPQLIAGPIVRFKSIAKQINHRVTTLDMFSKGMRLFIIGLAQKTLIANTVAQTADNVFALPVESLTTMAAWIGAFCYSIQIYFDFAGYSNMAIGMGLILGFNFPKNFNFPYISQSITEFWRRWHISLSTWFRDYLYIPMGGNRVNNLRTYVNLLIVFILCGLWHGAQWTFLVWGLYHGIFLIFERMFFSKLLKQIWRPFRYAYLIVIVLIGWVVFRVDDLNHMNYYLSSLIGLNEVHASIEKIQLLSHSVNLTILCAIIFSLPIKSFMINNDYFQNKNVLPLILCELFYFGLLLTSLTSIASGSYNPFIYFRF